MNNRQRLLAALRYEPYDRMPLVHFGFWNETIEKWNHEGHISDADAANVWDNSDNEKKLTSRLGFDFNYSCNFGNETSLFPTFEPKLLEITADGFHKEMNHDGAIVLVKPGVVSIPAEVGHTLVDRASWEEHYKWRLQYSDDRVNMKGLEALKALNDTRDYPQGLSIGSLFGRIRDIMGVVGISYLVEDDEELYDEIINTFADMQYKVAEKALSVGAQFDFAHYWEDICYNHGPLVNPSVFREKVGPHYKRMTNLCNAHGIDIISLDCDGQIDSLLPIWFENGVNTMFPIEVGTWDANIRPWREKYGRDLRGVGGMNKTVFAQDYAAIDAEVERLRGLVELGGYIPCPDHRIAPDAIFENVQYYCEKMHKVFG